MALVWSILPVPQFMLVLQAGVFWAGLWLLARALRRNVILLVGLSPVALYYNGIILKDALLCSTLVLAAGLFANRWMWGSRAASLAAAFIRVNAGAALAPFVVRRHRILWSIVIAAGCAFAVQAVSDTFAERTHVERSLPLFDLAGIDYFSGGHEFRDGCYTPLFWDTLAEPRCGDAFQHSGELTRQWIGAILHHPLAYAEHRIAHFNRETFFIVPPAEQCVDAPEMHQCPVPLWKDAVMKNALLWPCVWLAIGLALLALSDLGRVGSGLALSGVLYGLAYVVVGVASDFRFFYWTEIAVQLALVIAWTRSANVRAPLGIGFVVVLIGYASRYLL